MSLIKKIPQIDKFNARIKELNEYYSSKDKEFKNADISLLEEYLSSINYLPYEYKNKNKFSYYDNIADIIINNFKCPDSLIKLFIIDIICLMKGQYILHRMSEKFITHFLNITDEYILTAANQATLPVFIFMLKNMIKNKISIPDLDKAHILMSAFRNTDDRVYKYLMSEDEFKNTHFGVKSNFTDLLKTHNKIYSIFNYIFSPSIPDKYVLRRIKSLSEIVNISEFIGYICNFSSKISLEVLEKIFKYYFKNDTCIFNTKDRYSEKIIWVNIFDSAIKICIGHEEDPKTIIERLNKLYQLITNQYLKNIFIVSLFSITANNFGFIVKSAKKINDPNIDSYRINRLKVILKSFLYTGGSLLLGIKSNILSLYDKKDITENFINFFEKYYCDTHFISKLLLLSHYLGYIKPIYNNEKLNKLLISYNCILFNLKMFIKKKQKLKVIANTVRLKPLMKELSAISTTDLSKAVFRKFTINNKQKFNKIPPYSVYPKLLENIRCSIMLREKADGVTVNSLPSNISPSIPFNDNLKAEYIEDLDLYLVFDVDIEKNIMDRYRFLRNLHPSTQKLRSNIISKFDDFISYVNFERKNMEKFLEKDYDSYRWYPKAAWEVNNLDTEFIEKLYSLINLEIPVSKPLINWVCRQGPYANDGLIVTPLNGDREIKLKPKELMTIDLLYKNHKWLDGNNFEYSRFIKNEEDLDFIDNTIWRCYPVVGFFVPREIRYDKVKPNPRNVVNTIMHLVKINFTTEKVANLYYTNEKFTPNSEWKKIGMANKRIITTMLQKVNITSANILDLGCGAGKLLKLIKKFKNYYGIDYDINILTNTVQKYNNNNKVFNYLDLAIEWNSLSNKWMEFDFNQKFDTIFCLSSVMHFFTDIFWDQINIVVKKGTKMIFNLVNDKAKDPYHFSNGYLKVINDKVHYCFDPVHESELVEPFISNEMVQETIEKYDWSITETFTPTCDLNSYYTWFIITKN